LAREGEYGVLQVTDRGQEVLGNRDAHVGLAIAQRATPSKPQPRPAAATSDPLFERLRALRKRLADELGVPPYIIFHDRVLREMVEARPRTVTDLLHISGIGTRKAADYGEIFLAEIAELPGAAIPEPARTLSQAGQLPLESRE